MMPTGRNCLLEIDKMKGARLPPGEKSKLNDQNNSSPPVFHDGKNYDLTEIFSGAGIKLKVKVNDEEIPSLGDYYSQADLMNLMNSRSGRKKPSKPPNMYAYLVIIDGIIQLPGSDGILRPNPGILGIMFDLKRRGTAVFYKNDFIHEQPVAFLRTSAHEVGHQFNLHHRDGSMYTTHTDGAASVEQRKYTVMNQTGVIQQYGGWPQGISLDFGSLESAHLSKHPYRYVTPGGSNLDGSCTADHNDWHNDAPTRLGVNEVDLTEFDTGNSKSSPTKSLAFNIEMGKKEYLPGQPAIAYLKLTNDGSEPVSIIDMLDPEYNIVKFYVKKKNKEVRFMPYSLIEFVPKEKILNPGESVFGRGKIFYGSNGYTFPRPGKYEVRATFFGIGHGLGKTIDSNKTEVNLRSPRNKEEREQAKLITGKEQALFFLFEGGDHLKNGIRQLTKLANKYPNSILGSYANAVLGLHWSKEFKDFKSDQVRQPDNDKARSFLDTAANTTKGYWANATYLNLANLHKKSGERDMMKNILGNFVTKFEGDSKNTDGIVTAKKILNEEA